MKWDARGRKTTKDCEEIILKHTIDVREVPKGLVLG